MKTPPPYAAKYFHRWFLLGLILLLGACEITEIPRNPTLAPPLALKTFALAGAPNVAAFQFEAYNNESYFSGFLVYITTNRSDLERIDPTNFIFALRPLNAALVTNFRSPETNLTLTYNGAMGKAEKITFPHNAVIANGLLTSSQLSEYNEGAGLIPFVPGLDYYVGIYAYSIGDDRLSLPSIGKFNF